MFTFLRENKMAAGVLLFLRVYLGYNWMTAGWGKITSGFNAGGFLKAKVAEPVMGKGGDVVYPTYTAFLENVALPNADLFSFMVAWGEFLVGLGLILGVLTTLAAFFGLTMNFAFMFAGVVSSNPWMILLTFIILVAGANAGRYGGDRWMPLVKEYIQSKRT